MKPTSAWAVAVGSLVGVVAAIGGYGSSREEPPPLPPAAARPFAPSNIEQGAADARVETTAQSQVPAGEPAPPLPSSPASGALEPPMDEDSPIATKEDFEAAAIACDEKDAGACRRAANAAELGVVVPKDLKRAKTFRKVELTALVRGCEKNAVAACLTLADRYLRGDGLAQNERTALALLDHAREICARKPEDACRNVPAN